MFIRNSIVAATAALSLAGNVNAFWRLECRGRAGIARIDPLVNPGTVGSHVHHIHGSSGMLLPILHVEHLLLSRGERANFKMDSLAHCWIWSRSC